MQRRFRNSSIVIGAALASVLTGPLAASGGAAISRPGAYSGWSEPRFDGTELTSQYVSMRDGTRIAIDVIRPTLNGRVVSEPLPVLWMNTPYDRRRFENGETARDYPGAALALVRYGYVVAIADMRGNYASFGHAVHPNRNEWMPWAYWDAYDVTEWLAVQPWSDGKIGMWGCSATGHSQWQAAATHPPHLKAIFPMSAPSEYYEWGGMVPLPPASVKVAQPATPERAPTPVDMDRDGTLLARALQDQMGNMEPGHMPYRDSAAPEMASRLGLNGFRYWQEVSTFANFANIAASGIPAYQTANYGEDIRVKQGVFVKRANLPQPVKTILAPGNHCEWSSDFAVRPNNTFNIVTEERRWFDYWLKGIDNGILQEPSVLYYAINARPGDEWRQAWQWPLPNERMTSFYLTQGSGARGGGLQISVGAGGVDRYRVDYSVTPNDVDAKGQVYTTAPLAEDTAVAGHPVIDIWVSSTASDGDFVAWLEDVAPNGTAKRLPGTEDGRLRASHRRLGKPPFDMFGLPWHRSFKADVRPLVPGKPAELRFDMAPIAYTFAKGHRIRIAIAGVAADRRGRGGVTPVIDPAPVVTFHSGNRYPSRVELPLSVPVEARARLVGGEGDVELRLDFPSRLDVRYLADVSPGTVRLGTVAASSIHRIGRSLLVRFPVARSTLPGSILVTGAFGGRFDYGDDARFSALVKTGG